MELSRPNYKNSPYGSTLMVYVLNREMLKEFSGYLGSTNLDVANNKLYVDASSYIVSASIYPWVVSGGAEGLTTPMVMGGKRVTIRSGVVLNVWEGRNIGDPSTVRPYVFLPNAERDIGSVHIPTFFHDFRDYSATTINLWVPLVGFLPLDPAIVMDKDVYVTFVTDYAAAKSLYYVTVDAPFRAPSTLNPTGTDPRIIHTGDVDVAISLPLGHSNAADIRRNQITTMSNAIMSGAQGVLGGTMSSGAAGALQAGITGYANAALSYGMSMLQPRSTRVLPVDGGYVSYTGCNRVTAIIERRESVIPDNFAHSYGRPLMQTRRMSTLSGYTKAAKVHPEGIPCTAQELQEIEQKLLAGVIL